jgi:hypothetical protein
MAIALGGAYGRVVLDASPTVQAAKQAGDAVRQMQTKMAEASNQIQASISRQNQKAQEMANVMQQASNRANAAMELQKQKAQELANQNKALADSEQLVGAAFTGVAAAGGAAIYSSVQLAARVQTLGVVTRTLGANVGYSAQQIDDLEQSIKKQGITLQASRQAIAQMIEANLDLANATKLARLAQDAAVISGENSSQTFEKLIYVIASGNTLMARRMGLLVDFQGAYQREAKAMGVSTLALDENQKTQIRVNEVMRLGTNIAGAYENAMDTAGKKVTSLDRHVEESWRMLGEHWLPVYADAIDLVTHSLEAWENLDQAKKDDIASWIGLGTTISATEGVVFLFMGTATKAIGKLKELGAAMTGIKGIGAAGSLKAMAISLGPLAIGVAAVSAAVYGMIEANQKVKTITQDWTKSIDAQVKAEASAADIANQYIEKQKQVQDELNNSGLATKLFAQDQTYNTTTIDAVNQALQASSTNYEDYNSNLLRLVEASGYAIDTNGNLTKTFEGEWGPVTQIIEAHFELGKALYEDLHATDENMSAHERYRLGLKQTTDATEAAAAAAKALADAQKKVIEGLKGAALQAGLAGNLTKSWDDYRKSMADANSQDLQKQLDDLKKKGYDPNSKAIQDLNKQIADNEQKQKDLADQISKTTMEFIYQKASMGLNADASLELARKLGLIDESDYSAAKSVLDLNEGFDAMNGVMGDLGDTLDNNTELTQAYAGATGLLASAIAELKSKNITITVDTIFRTVNPESTKKGYGLLNLPEPPTPNPNPTTGGVQEYASGTQGWLTVPPGYTNDTYWVRMSSGEQFNVKPSGQSQPAPAGSGQGGGDTYNINVPMTVYGNANPDDIVPRVEIGVKRALRAIGKG